jgi:hypothetical protein
MFIRVSEETNDNFLRSAKTFCKDCEQYADVRLVERVRTVTAYWVLKSTERRHFLICDACKSQFKVKPHNKGDLEQADIHTLLQMAGGRYVPFSDQFILFLDVICVPIPVLNLVLLWAAWKNRAAYTPTMMKFLRFTLWAAPAVNLALLLAGLLDKPYEP